MQGHTQALKHGFLALLPVLDGAGRAIIYSKSSRSAELDENTEEVRYFSIDIHTYYFFFIL